MATNAKRISDLSSISSLNSDDLLIVSVSEQSGEEVYYTSKKIKFSNIFNQISSEMSSALSSKSVTVNGISAVDGNIQIYSKDITIEEGKGETIYNSLVNISSMLVSSLTELQRIV